MKTKIFTGMLAALTAISGSVGLRAQETPPAAPAIATAAFQKVANPIKGLFPLGNHVWAGSGMIWGDYNKDNHPDLLLWGYENGKGHFAKLYKNNGNETFTDATAEAFGGKLPQVARGAAVWFSYNNDAYIDLVILGDASGAKTKVFANGGNGTFTEVEGTSLPELTSSDNGNPNQIIGAADYDNDGYDDLLLMGSGSTFALYKNSGSAGGFSEQKGIFDSGDLPSANQGTLAWGDYNGDSYPDILFNGGDNKTGIYTNNAGANFTYTALGNPLNMGKVAWIDYDKDGDLDALITGWNGAYVADLYQNNAGTFALAADHGIPGSAKADIAVIDLNGDGYDDIVLAGEPDNISGIYYNAKNGTFAARTPVAGWPNGMSLSRVDVADYNGDGLLDIAVNANGAGNTAVYKNTGTAAAPEFQKVANLVPGVAELPMNVWAGSGIIWGDYNNDGYPDLYQWGYPNGASLGQLYKNNGDSTFSDVTAALFGNAVTGVDRGAATWFNFDGDEWQDLVIYGDKGGSHTKVFKNNGGTSFTEVENTLLKGLQTGNNDWMSKTIGAADYNKDGYDDLLLMGAESMNGTKAFLLYKNNNGVDFSLQNTLLDGGDFPQVNNGTVAWGDYNNDGYPDILFNGSMSDGDENKRTGVYANNSGASFTYVAFHDPVERGEVAWIDYNGDGSLDALVTGANGTGRHTYLYRNTGAAGSYAFVQNTAHGIENTYQSSIAVADINGDGKDDIILLGDVGTDIYYNNGDSTFTKASIGWSNMSRSRVDVADFNKDGLLDIVINASSDNNTALYLNTGITPAAEQPGEPGEQPGEPGEPGEQPGEPGEQPSEPGEQPSEPGEQPGEPGEQPSEPGEQPSDTIAGNPTFKRVDMPIKGLPLTQNVWAGNGIIWGDYNNDGKPDLLHWGYENDAPGNRAMTRIYKNNGDGSFTDVSQELFGEVILAGDRGSVAWIDYDKDEWLDLVAYCDKGGSRTGIFKNNGGTSFTQVEIGESAALIGLQTGDNDYSTRTIAVADYDKDGYDDVLLMGASAYGGAKQFLLYKHNGAAGGFTLQGTLFEGGYFPSVNNGSVVWGDYNNDSYPDILFNGSDGSTRYTGIYANNAAASFTYLALGDVPLELGAATWIDYNKDGNLDVLVSGYDGGTYQTYLYLNSGTSGSYTFTKIDNHGIPGSAKGDIVVDDLNGDGYDDVALVGENSASGIYLNNGGNGTFTLLKAGLPVTNLSKSRVDVADYNGDGLLDVVVSQQSNTALYKNVGTATAPAYRGALPLTGFSDFFPEVWAGSGIAWGDYNGDTYPDLLFWGYNNKSHFAMLYKNNGDSTLTDVTAEAFDGKLPQVARGGAVWFKYDNDENLDLVITGDGDGSFHCKIFRNNGNGTFTVVAEDSTKLLPLNNYSNGGAGNEHITKNIGAADYDKDGYDDLLFMGSPSDGSKLFALYKNNGGTDFTRQTTLLEGGDFPQVNDGSVAWGDYNNDGYPDILFNGSANIEGLLTGIYVNNGGASFTYVALPNPTEQGEVAWLDYDGDSILDVLVTGKSGATPHTYLYRNTGAAGSYAFEAVSGHGLPDVTNSAVDVADLNGDGKDDVVLLGSVDGVSAVYFSKEDGTFAKSDIGLPSMGLGRVNITDYNKDGLLDIMVNARNRTALYKNMGVVAGGGDGDGDNDDGPIPFEKIASPITASANPFGEVWAGSGAIWGDYNSDTYPDLLFWGYNNSNHFASLYRNNGDGTFTDTTAGAFAGLLPQVARGSAAWFKYNNDSYLDLVIFGEQGGQHTEIFSSNGDGTFTKETVSLPQLQNAEDDASNANSMLTKLIGVADYDKDGFDDLLLMGATGSGEGLSIFALYKNNGAAGDFTKQTGVFGSDSLPQVKHGTVAWGDHNGDGYPDILFNGSTALTSHAGVYTNNAGTGFTYAALTQEGTEQGEVAWVDADADGKLDALITGLTATGALYTGLFRNTGTGFTEVANHGIPNTGQSAAAAADLNGDGKQDLVLIGSNDASDVYLSNGDGTFAKVGVKWPKTMTSGRVDIADYNKDGLQDIVVNSRQKTAVYKNIGAAAAPVFIEEDVVERAGSKEIQPITVGSGAIWGDYNGDGHHDLLVWGAGNGRNLTKLYRNSGTGSFTEVTLPPTFPKLRRGAAAWLDYNKDGRLDLLLAGVADVDGVVTQLYKNTLTGFEPVTNAGLPNVQSGNDNANGRYLAVADYNNDGYPDIFIQGESSDGFICNLYKNEGGTGEFSPQIGAVGDGRSFDKLKPGMHAWGDYNRDGFLDLLFTGNSAGIGSGNYATSEGYYAGVYKNNGNGTFENPVYFANNPAGSEGEAAWIDVDGDGYLDALLTGSNGAQELGSIYRYNSANNAFELLADAGLPGTSSSSVAVGDLDGNGTADVLLYGTSSSEDMARVFYNDGNGAFTQSSYQLSAGSKGMVALVDFDGDRKLDVAIVGNPEVALYRNLDSTPALPGLPANLSATPDGNGKVTFTWSAPAAGTPMGYNLFIRKSGATAPLYIALPASTSGSSSGKLSLSLNSVALLNANTLTVSGLDESGTYTWGVEAVSSAWVASSFAIGTFTIAAATNPENPTDPENPSTAVDKSDRSALVAYKRGETLVVATGDLGRAELSVVSVTGARVWAKTGNFAGSTEINGLPQGAVYLVVLRIGSSVEVKKVAM
jgi:hypothetical protein